MMKPESMSIAESKRKQDCRTKSKRYASSVQKINIIFMIGEKKQTRIGVQTVEQRGTPFIILIYILYNIDRLLA